MKNENRAIERQIIEFLAVIEDCLKSTTFAADRAVFQQDIPVVASWLTAMHRGTEVNKVIDQILDPQTDKYFGDYWRQGDWGEKEMSALKDLQTALQNYRHAND